MTRRLIDSGALPHRVDDERSRAGSHAADSREPADRGAEKSHRGIQRRAQGDGISGPFVPLLRSPEVMNRARAMGDYLRFNSVLPPRLSEFAILITARSGRRTTSGTRTTRWRSRAASRRTIIEAIAEGRRPEKMADDEDVLYTFCDELHRNQSISDATYARAVAHIRRAGRHRHRRHLRLLHLAGHGAQHRPHAGARRPHTGPRAVSPVKSCNTEVTEVNENHGLP